MKDTNSLAIRPANKDDIASMVTLSDTKRKAYENANPQLWKRAVNANEVQHEWFTSLLNKPDYFIYVAEHDSKISGFIIGQNVAAPEVYNPGGMTLLVDDFCVAAPELWETVGNRLISDVCQTAKVKGAIQVVVVCGHHDTVKRAFLKKQRINIASEWHMKSL